MILEDSGKLKKNIGKCETLVDNPLSIFGRSSVVIKVLWVSANLNNTWNVQGTRENFVIKKKSGKTFSETPGISKIII